jgi:hypothetical protein
MAVSLKCSKCGGDNFVVKSATLLERLMVFVSRKRKYRCWNCGHAFRFWSASSFQKIKIMELNRMLAELRGERDRIDQAILALERLQNGHAKRRGRPPGWLANLKTQQDPDKQSPARQRSKEKAS